ncbi:MAG TPA: hypothetical protein PLJ55_05540 [Kiritimatiellia bacterium]|jgi:hypothetical protein|nr:MAG: hypothetical protein BWX54_00418 [Verrucomicrobia bacterium ADurb.Bin018]HOU58936.1 hypothetical protein [Kiritimatiellia bacterium]HQK44417.1 hypothetical protein [Kiritimatiellia bacterium]
MSKRAFLVGLLLMFLSLIPLIWGEVQLQRASFRAGYGSEYERDQYRITINELEDIHKLKRLSHLLLNVSFDQEQAIVQMHRNQLSSNRWRFAFQLMLLVYLTTGYIALSNAGKNERKGFKRALFHKRETTAMPMTPGDN